MADPLTIPNIITIARLFLVPIIVSTMTAGWYEIAFTLFLIAGLSDALDGYIAKRWNMQSELGAYLDPLADKLLIVSIFIVMADLGLLPVWLVGLVIARDVSILVAVGLATVIGRPLTIRPLYVSKATTAAQIALATTVLFGAAYASVPGDVITALIWASAALTLLSAIAYWRMWRRHLTGAGGGMQPADTSAVAPFATQAERHPQTQGLRNDPIRDFDVGVATSHRSVEPRA